MKMRIVSFISLLCLVCFTLCACAPITSFVADLKYDKSATFIDTEEDNGFLLEARFTMAPDYPWDNSLYMLGWVETCTYSPEEEIKLYFKAGLKDSFLGEGSLRITIETEDWSTSADGKDLNDSIYIIESFTLNSYTKDTAKELCISLSPDFTNNWAEGIVKVSVDFLPKDMNAFIAKAEEAGVYDIEYLTESGYLSLEYADIVYAADSHETRLDPKNSGGTLYWDLIKDHYNMELITEKEFADLYYDELYHGSISTPILSYMSAEHTMKIAYYSENIRYESEDYIADEELWQLYLTYSDAWKGNDYQAEIAAERAVSERILLLIKERGIITDEEYETEAALMRSTTRVTLSVPAGNNEATRNKIIDKYKLTHFDP